MILCVQVLGLVVVALSYLPGICTLTLAGGRYNAETDPTSEAKIALEAAAIKETEDLDKKKNIFKNVSSGPLS